MKFWEATAIVIENLDKFFVHIFKISLTADIGRFINYEYVINHSF